MENDYHASTKLERERMWGRQQSAQSTKSNILNSTIIECTQRLHPSTYDSEQHDRQVKFYRHRTSSSPDMNIVVSTARFPDIYALADHCASVMDIPREERYFHAFDGHTLRHLGQFEHGGKYYFGGLRDDTTTPSEQLTFQLPSDGYGLRSPHDVESCQVYKKSSKGYRR